MQANLNAWVRLKRLDIREFASALGTSALEHLGSWPRAGEGRAIKAASEELLRVTDSHAIGGLRRARDEFEAVRKIIVNLKRNSFFTAKFSNSTYIDRRNEVRTLFEALGDLEVEVVNFIDTVSSSQSKDLNISPIAAEEIENIVPKQQLGPLYFAVSKGRLTVQKRKSHPLDGAEDLAEQARQKLIIDARSIVNDLGLSNSDQRVVDLINVIIDGIEASSNIIQIGISVITLNKYCDRMDDEIPLILSAKIKGLALGLNHYVGQHKEWEEFAGNSASADFTADDLESTKRVAGQIIDGLEANSEFVAPEVPNSIRLLMEAISKPAVASKRAAYAVIRAIENLVSAMCNECIKVVKSSADGVAEGAKVGSKALALSAILTVGGALVVSIIPVSTLSPSLLSVMKAEWLQELLKVIGK